MRREIVGEVETSCYRRNRWVSIGGLTASRSAQLVAAAGGALIPDQAIARSGAMQRFADLSRLLIGRAEGDGKFGAFERGAIAAAVVANEYREVIGVGHVETSTAGIRKRGSQVLRTVVEAGIIHGPGDCSKGI